MSKYIKEHSNYYYNDAIIPSVTEVIGLLNKPELVVWANNIGKHGIDSTQYTNDAAKLGTIVHFILERCIKNKLIPLEDYYQLSSKKQIKVDNCINAFKEWKKEYKPNFIHSEFSIQNNRVGGTIDLICNIDNDITIVDFKTSKKAYPTYFIQLAGYNYLLRTVKNIKTKKVGILVLKKNNGRYNFNIMDTKYLEKYYEPLFLNLLDTYYLYNYILNNDWKE